MLANGEGAAVRRMTAAVVLLALLGAGCKDQARIALVPPPQSAVPRSVAIQEPSPVYVNSWTLEPLRKNLVEQEIAAPDVTRATAIPFAVLRAEGAIGAVAFDLVSRRAELRLNGGPTVSFPSPGIPVSMQTVGQDRYAIAFRGIPQNILWLIDWNAKTGVTRFQKIEREGVEYLMFRGALIQDGALHWIVFDSRAEKNFLRRYEESGGVWRLAREVELPTLEDPAGTHYELQPPLFIFAEADQGVRILGGTLDATVRGDQVGVKRIPECERTLEAVRAREDVAILCNRRTVDARGAYVIHDPSKSTPTFILNSEGIPYRLSWNAKENHADFMLAKDARAYAELFEYDIERGQNSGLLDFGSDNIQGRLAWSQIYYINGLMDAIYMARRDDKAFNVFSPLLRRMRLRIEMEVRLIDQLLSEPTGIHTRTFTRDRTPALFAVQTSRVLLLLLRFQKEFPDARPLVNLDRLREQVIRLDKHIEVLADSGEARKWMAPGVRHLRWPRGSAFYFDGLAVPYNHQNEWAYSVFEARRGQHASSNVPDLDPQREIIRHFLKHLASNGKFPVLTDWYYWWGHAYDGYDTVSNRSVNKPSYTGDKSLAWISFRTIDLMSVLSGLYFMPEIESSGLIASALQRVQHGEVYPFAARLLVDSGNVPGLREHVAHRYARAGSPWELSNAPWALAMLPTK